MDCLNSLSRFLRNALKWDKGVNTLLNTDLNHLVIGQKLYAINGDEVILKSITSDDIIVEYKGKKHRRSKTVLGDKLFLKNPLEQSVNSMLIIEQAAESETTFNDRLYVGKTLYNWENNKCTIVGISQEDLTIRIEHLVHVTTNSRTKTEEQIFYETRYFTILDIGTKLFFRVNDCRLPKQDLLKEPHYSKYISRIEEKMKTTEKEQLTKIKRYAPNNRLTTLRKQLLIDSYRFKEDNSREETEFKKQNNNGEYFARLDIDTFFHDSNNLFKEHYYVKVYLSQKPVGELIRLNKDDVVWQINAGLYTKHPGEVSRSQFKTLAEWEKDYYFQTGIVIDWRAPIADLFYSTDKTKLRIEKVQIYEHELMLKRRFENNLYQDLYRSGDNLFEEGSVDPFLIKVLNENKNKHQLSDIIRTIQSNQNDIIRSPIKNNIIVQGCAGSGKTMILLHRLSYLLYNNKNLKKQRIKILTPNELFNLHINELSITLELNDIERVTVEGYYLQLVQGFDKGLHTQENFKSESETDENNKLANYIYSDHFKNAFQAEYESWLTSVLKLDTVDSINQKYALKVETQERLSNHEKVSEFSSCINLIYKRLLEISKLYSEKTTKNQRLEVIALQLKSNTDTDKNPLLREFEEISAAINIIQTKLEKRKLAQIDESMFLNDMQVITALKEDLDSLSTTNVFDRIFSTSISKGLTTDSLENSKKFIDSVSLQYYKFTIYAKLFFCFLHYGQNQNVDNILFIDEGQDLSLNEYQLLKEINGSSTIFNIFGDTNQLIKIGRGISDWNNLQEANDFHFYSLNENYRNTREITEFCNKVFSFKAVPIGPSGKDIRTISKSQMIAELSCIKISRQRIAIIAKSISHLDSFINLVPKPLEVENKSIAFLDVESAKGLEFDIVYVLPDKMSVNERYISFTRALSELVIVE